MKSIKDEVLTAPELAQELSRFQPGMAAGYDYVAAAFKHLGKVIWNLHDRISAMEALLGATDTKSLPLHDQLPKSAFPSHDKKE